MLKKIEHLKKKLKFQYFLKDLLSIFGSTLHLKSLLAKVSTKNRLVSLFSLFFLRLDFFLVLSNFAATGAQARQLILHKHVIIFSSHISSWVPNSINTFLKINDCITLSRINQLKFTIMSRLLNRIFFKKYWLKLILKQRKNLHIFFLNSHLKSTFSKNLQFRFKNSTATYKRRKMQNSFIISNKKLLDKLEPLQVSDPKMQKILNLIKYLLFDKIVAQYFPLKYRKTKYRKLVNSKQKHFFKKSSLNRWQLFRYSEYLVYHPTTFSVKLFSKPLPYTIKQLSLFSLDRLYFLSYTF